jgi:hypothetical protein
MPELQLKQNALVIDIVLTDNIYTNTIPLSIPIEVQKFVRGVGGWSVTEMHWHRQQKELVSESRLS